MSLARPNIPPAAQKASKILFLVNIGRRNKQPPAQLFDDLSRVLDEAGVDCTMIPCRSTLESAEAVAGIASRGYDTLWIGGGDGSINQLLNATFGSGVNYGIVPMGTVNALGRSLGIPIKDPVASVKYLLEAKPQPMDVIRVNEFYFMCYASVGYHAGVMHSISPAFKKQFGKLAFWTSGIQTAVTMRLLPQFVIDYLEIEPGADILTASASVNVRETAYSAIISNICNFAGFGIVREEPCDSRGLELHLFQKSGRWPMVKWFVRMNLGHTYWSEPHHGISHHKITGCVLRSPRPMLLQVDGEPVQPANPKELRFEVLSRAVNVLLR